jgi:hypothetical protein
MLRGIDEVRIVVDWFLSSCGQALSGLGRRWNRLLPAGGRRGSGRAAGHVIAVTGSVRPSTLCIFSLGLGSSGRLSGGERTVGPPFQSAQSYFEVPPP